MCPPKHAENGLPAIMPTRKATPEYVSVSFKEKPFVRSVFMLTEQSSLVKSANFLNISFHTRLAVALFVPADSMVVAMLWALR